MRLKSLEDLAIGEDQSASRRSLEPQSPIGLKDEQVGQTFSLATLLGGVVLRATPAGWRDSVSLGLDKAAGHKLVQHACHQR